MATITLTGYALDRANQPIASAVVTAHAVNTNGTKVTAPAATTAPNGTTGKWTFTTLDSTSSQTGTFAVKIAYGSEERWINPDTVLQVATLVGPHGVAPLGANSITDAQLGNRTINSTTRLAADTSTLTGLLNGMAYMLKTISGKANWYDLPAASLQEAYNHSILNGNPHSTTAAQVGAIPSTDGIIRLAVGTDASKTSFPNGTLYIATDTNRIYYRAATGVWDQVSAS